MGVSYFVSYMRSFNTQPPEGGWFGAVFDVGVSRTVSTHSRLKAAGIGRV